MTYNGKWSPLERPDIFRIDRAGAIILNIIEKKPRNEYEIWTIAQENKTPLSWDQIHDGLRDLALKGYAKMQKAEE